MLPVLHLDPVPELAAAVAALAVQKKKAARRRLSSILMMMDQTVVNAGFDFRRYAMNPTP
jgi:hypothetical protein